MEVEIYDSADCAGFPVAGDSAEVFADPGIEVFVEEGTTTTFSAMTYDAEFDLSSECSTDTVTYTHATGECATDPKLCPVLSDLELAGKSSIKQRKKRKLKLTLTNSGGGPAQDVVADLVSSNSKVKVKPKQLTFETVGAQDTATLTFLAKAKRSAKGSAVISATSGKLSAEHTLQVKKKK
jgi:hypothetical protein